MKYVRETTYNADMEVISDNQITVKAALKTLGEDVFLMFISNDSQRHVTIDESTKIQVLYRIMDERRKEKR